MKGLTASRGVGHVWNLLTYSFTYTCTGTKHRGKHRSVPCVRAGIKSPPGHERVKQCEVVTPAPAVTSSQLLPRLDAGMA